MPPLDNPAIWVAMAYLGFAVAMLAATIVVFLRRR
jgi:hypothetical protein